LADALGKALEFVDGHPDNLSQEQTSLAQTNGFQFLHIYCISRLRTFSSLSPFALASEEVQFAFGKLSFLRCVEPAFCVFAVAFDRC